MENKVPSRFFSLSPCLFFSGQGGNNAYLASCTTNLFTRTRYNKAIKTKKKEVFFFIVIGTKIQANFMIAL